MSVRKHLLALAVLGAMGSTLTHAATSAPATPPAGETASSAIDIPFSKFKLDNGLTVVVHTDRKAPIVAVNVWYHVGSKDERPGRTGFAHLFEHLMFNGSENYNDEYFGPFEKVGATDMNGTTWLDRTNYFQNVPTTALDMALWMESDRMGHLLGAITQAKLDEQRGVVQNEKRQGENQPYGKADEAIQKAVFPNGHPYSWETIGSMEDLNAAKLEDVHAWFKQYYGAANTVVVLAGDIDVATAKEKMQKYFGDIQSGPPLTRREAWIAKRTENTRDVMHDRVSQTRLYKTWNTPQLGSRDSDQLSLIAAILGGGKNSRLYKTLVYDKQLATSVYANNQEFELASMWQIVADVKPGVDHAVVDRIIEDELNKLIASGPTADELARVKASVEAGFIRGVERIGGFGGKSDVLATWETYLGDAGAWKTQLENYRKADAKSLQATARNWLSSGVHTLEVHPFPNYTAAKTGADRSKLPEVSSAPELVFPKVQRTTLKNGLNVVLAERHTIPTIGFQLQFDSGFAADQGGKLGTANFAVSMLDEGTRSRSSLQISAEAERLGAQLGSGCGLDTCSVSLDALKQNTDASLALFADVVRNPDFSQEEIDRVRGRWINGIKREKTQAQSMALRTLPPLLYGANHAYGIPFTGSGTEASISSLTRADLQAFHQRWLRPDNATLVVVGDTTLNEIVPKLEQAFSGWQAPATAKPVKQIAEVQLPAKARVFLIDKPGAEQSTIIAGQVFPSARVDNYLTLNALNDAIGGQFSSRLNMNLREDKHWAYGAYAFTQDAVGQRPYLAFAPVQTDKTAESVKEVIKEYRDLLGSKPVTAAELEKSVLNAVRALPGAYETAGAVQGTLSWMVQYQRPDNYVETLKGRYEAIKLDDVNAAAKATLKPEQFTWVIVGDLAKIEQGVRDLKLGEVTVLDVDGNKLR